MFAAAAVVPAVASAQTESDFKNAMAYAAINSTPAGALAATSWGVDAIKSNPTYDLRYGRMSYEGDFSVSTYGLGASAAFAGGRLGGAFGVQNCDGCDNTYMFGADYERSLFQGKVSPSAQYAIGVQPALGYGRSTSQDINGNDVSANALSMAVGVPVSITGGKAWRTSAYVTPGFGFGRISSEGDSESGTRPMIGAGARVRHVESGFGALVNLQKVVLDGGKTQLGLGLSWMPRGR